MYCNACFVFADSSQEIEGVHWCIVFWITRGLGIGSQYEKYQVHDFFSEKQHISFLNEIADIIIQCSDERMCHWKYNTYIMFNHFIYHIRSLEKQHVNISITRRKFRLFLESELTQEVNYCSKNEYIWHFKPLLLLLLNVFVNAQYVDVWRSNHESGNSVILIVRSFALTCSFATYSDCS